jgi:hypothetical protein
VPYAIKTEIRDPRVRTFAFAAQKTMYGGKHIAAGDTVFIFASENEGGQGLVARGIVTAAEAVPRKPGIARQTPRVSVCVRCGGGLPPPVLLARAGANRTIRAA